MENAPYEMGSSYDVKKLREHCADAADAGGGGFLFYDFEPAAFLAEFAGVANVGNAAKFK